MAAKLVSFHVPADKELLTALGEVALRHEHMNHIIKMTIKSLAGISLSEAILATTYESSGQLRDRARKLARKRLGEGKALLRLQALLANCKKLTEKRNALMHGVWAQELDGEPQIRDAYGVAGPLPTAEELNNLAKEIEDLTNLLNMERLEGFLYEALSENENVK